MKALIHFCAFLGLICNAVTGQNCCVNNDFSLQNFLFWEGYTGFYSNCCPDTGIIAGRHTIIASQYFDPYTCGGLQVIPPGFNQSCRLGNYGVGGEAERLRKTICVSPSESILVYHYAIVLQEPGHLPEDQPKFDFRITDSLGQIIDSVCGRYSVYAQPGLPGFHTCTYYNGPFFETIVWRNWTTVGFDLSPYIGQNITIEFTTYDCNLGAHFGYAYFVSECIPSEIIVSKCEGVTNVNLTAPPGFKYLWFNGDTNQVITLINPDTSLYYSVTMTAVTGCSFSLQTKIKTTQVNAGILISDSCSNHLVLEAIDSIVNGYPINYLWDYGTGSGFQSGSKHQTLQVPAPGIYQLALAIQSNTGCWDTAYRQVTTLAVPNVSFSLTGYCAGDSIHLSSNSSLVGPSVLKWYVDQTFLSNDSNTYVVLDQGTHSIGLAVLSLLTGCSDSMVKTLNVEAKPIIGINALPDICENDNPLYLFPYITNNIPGVPTFTGSGITGLFFDPKNSGSGNHTLHLLFIAANGCTDTVSTGIFVNSVPEILLAPIPELCIYSDSIRLRDYVFTLGSIDSLHFIGPGVIDNFFYPSQNGVGVSKILVHNESLAGNCKDSMFFAIPVLPVPEINLDPFLELCVYQSPVKPPYAFPSYGSYSGSAINSLGLIAPAELGIGTFFAEYTVEYFKGCILRDTMIVTISDSNCYCTFYLANAFTPNNDQINDMFAPVFDCDIQEYSFQVFDRWGMRVFETSNTHDAWDGTFHGKPCPVDAYVVLIFFRGHYRSLNSLSIREEHIRSIVYLIR